MLKIVLKTLEIAYDKEDRYGRAKIHFLLYSTRREGTVDKLIEGEEKISMKMQ